jgi:hypothetical protein
MQRQEKDVHTIAAVMGLENCNHNRVPKLALGLDPDGKPMDVKWGYRSVVGMLLYLSTNTRPVIAYRVSQAAQAQLDPHRSLALDLFVDTDFVSLYKHEPD